MDMFTPIQFDGTFLVNFVQGGLELLGEVGFTAFLHCTVTDETKFNMMFGGQLPVDILKQEASLAVKKTFTNHFESGCTPNELKSSAEPQLAFALQSTAFSDWEGRAGIQLARIDGIVLTIDSKTEAMLSTMMSMDSNSVSSSIQSGWKCSCGAESKGKFCPECGLKKPI